MYESVDQPQCQPQVPSPNYQLQQCPQVILRHMVTDSRAYLYIINPQPRLTVAMVTDILARHKGKTLITCIPDLYIHMRTLSERLLVFAEKVARGVDCMICVGALRVTLIVSDNVLIVRRGLTECTLPLTAELTSLLVGVARDMSAFYKKHVQ